MKYIVSISCLLYVIFLSDFVAADGSHTTVFDTTILVGLNKSSYNDNENSAIQIILPVGLQSKNWKCIRTNKVLSNDGLSISMSIVCSNDNSKSLVTGTASCTTSNEKIDFDSFTISTDTAIVRFGIGCMTKRNNSIGRDL